MRDRTGQYKLLERIAQGGMGEVYKAKLIREAGFEKLVAVKRMLPALTRRVDFVSRFRQEARLAARLNHANIVHIYDFGQEEDTLFLAMEYVDGPDLSRLMTRLAELSIPFPLYHALRIAKDACKGLDYAHRLTDESGRSLGLVHGDISPGNILLDAEGEVKLVDFGLAKVRRGDDASEDRLAGKLCYLSPEQVRGEPQDRRSDIYALGLVLFELVYGRKAFAPDVTSTEGSSPSSLFTRICGGCVDRPADVVLPDTVTRILERALSVEKAQRYDTAHDMAQVLDDALSSLEKPERPLSWYVAQAHATHDRTPLPLPDRTIVSETPIEHPRKKGTLVAESPFAAEAQTTQTQGTDSPPDSPAASLQTRASSSTASSSRAKRRAWPVLVALAVVLVVAYLAFWNSPRSGPVTVTVEPPHADLFLNGKRQAATRPLVLRGLATDKEHVMEARAPGHREERRPLELKEDQPETVAIVLHPLTRSVRLESEPPGAEVRFEGVLLPDATPVTIPDIPLATPRTVTLSLAGYVPVTKEFLITEAGDEPYPIRVKLASLLGSLRVATDPEDALLFLEGRRVPGSSPFVVDNLVRGKEYRLQIGAKGRREQSVPVLLREEGETPLDIHLEPAEIVLRLEAEDGLTLTANGKHSTKLEWRKPPTPLLVAVQAPEGTLHLRVEIYERHEGMGRFSARGTVGFNCGASWATIRLANAETFTTPKSGVSFSEGATPVNIRFGANEKERRLVFSLSR